MGPPAQGTCVIVGLITFNLKTQPTGDNTGAAAIVPWGLAPLTAGGADSCGQVEELAGNVHFIGWWPRRCTHRHGWRPGRGRLLAVPTR